VTQLQPEVYHVLASAAGGGGIDAADVPDERWETVPAFGLVAARDRKLLPDAAVDAFPMSRQQTAMVAQMTLGAAMRRRRPQDWVPAYHNVATFSLTVPRVEASALIESGEVLVQRHEMFRSMLDLDTYSRPMQVVLNDAVRPLVEVHDLRGVSDECQRAEVARFAAAQNARTIDLRCPSLVDFAVHVLTDRAITLTVTEPHAISDGWSTHLNVVDFFEGYSNALAGRPPVVTADPVPFHLRAHSAQQLWQAQSTEDRDWWRAYLAVEDSTSDGHDSSDTYQWRETIDICGETFATLLRLGEQLGVGLKSILLALHLRALEYLTRQETATTGVTVNTRLAVPLGTDARGMFLNVVPMRAPRTIAGAASIVAMHRALMQVTARGRVPLADVAEVAGRGALATSFFVYNSFHSVAGVAGRLGIDTLENFEDWSHTEFPFEAAFNRSEEVKDAMSLLLTSESSPYPKDRALLAYRSALRDLVRLGKESLHV
jgi:hypothetical protein